MKKYYLALFAALLLNFGEIAYASTITETVYGTLHSYVSDNPSGGDYTGLTTGNQYELFSVTYDNTGTAMYEYRDNGTQLGRGWTLPALSEFYTYLSDATYTFGSELSQFRTNNGGGDWLSDQNRNRAYGVKSNNSKSYDSTVEDYYMLVNSHSTSTSSNFKVEDGNEYVTRLNFRNIEVAVTGQQTVPEPATMFLFGLGLLGLTGINRRKK